MEPLGKDPRVKSPYQAHSFNRKVDPSNPKPYLKPKPYPKPLNP